jgi:hypothetical protein
MICAGTPYGGRGPRSVSDYSTNKFVCEIMLIHSDIKIYFNFPPKHFKVIYSTNSILLNTSTNCKNQITECLEWQRLNDTFRVYGFPLPSF